MFNTRTKGYSSLTGFPRLSRLEGHLPVGRPKPRMTRLFLVLALVFTASLYVEAQGRRSEERKARSLGRVSRQLDRLSSTPDLSQESRFLHEQAASLLERASQTPAGSDLFYRLESAMENLLDASGQILRTRPRERDTNIEAARRRAVRDLERSYFRVLQGDYFARQSQESNAAEYVVTARQLYQLARAAYDEGDLRRARNLAEASRRVTSGLEDLALAAVPLPEPPRLPER